MTQRYAYARYITNLNYINSNLYPYLLKEYNRRWYLIAADENDNKMLNFSLDRIDQCVPLSSHKYVPYKGDISKRFDDIIGITLNEDSPVYDILLWASDSSKHYIATKPIHESQCRISGEAAGQLRHRYKELEGGEFFRISCKENYELVRELTTFGKDLIVLEPACIQDRVFERVNSLSDVYQKLRNA